MPPYLWYFLNVGSEDLIQVFILARQVLYGLNYLPSPEMFIKLMVLEARRSRVEGLLTGMDG